MNELKKLLENAGVISEIVDAHDRHVMQANQDKIVKTLISFAHAMDKAARPSVDNPSKSNISVYINYQLEQIIDDLKMKGYDIQWTEQGWED